MDSVGSSISAGRIDSSPPRDDGSATTLHTRSSSHDCHDNVLGLPIGRVSSDGCETTAHQLEAGSLEILSPSISSGRSSFSTVYAEEWPNFLHHHPPAQQRSNAPEESGAPTAVGGELEMAFPAESQPFKDTSTATEQNQTDSLLEKTDKGALYETVWTAWWLEMLSSLLALGCIISIAIILFLYDEKPLPDWPALISVNSLTAIFTAVFKASLIMPIAEGLGQLKWNWFQRKQKLSDVVVFDDASRGPWGSLLLIVKQLPRRRRAYLAVIGSLITLAALAVDPVSQAMIEHRGCQLTRASGALEVAEVSRTNNYTARTEFYPEFMQWAIDPIMEAAISKGVMDPEEIETQVAFECTTGNCTFGMGDDDYFFSSLSICHSCHDITDDVREIQPTNVTGDDLGKDRSWQLLDDDWSQVSTARGKTLLSITGTSSLQTSNGSIASYDVLMVTLTCEEPENPSRCTLKSKFANPVPFAARCSLYPCVKRYYGKVTNGIYRETEQKESEQPLNGCHVNGSNEQIRYVLVTNSSLIDGEERQCIATTSWKPQTVKVDSIHHSIYMMGYPPEGEKASWEYYPQECIWAFSYIASGAISYVLDDHLIGNLTRETDVAGQDHVFGSIWFKQVYAEGSGNISTVDHMLRGLANSMTAALRNNPGPKESQSHLSLGASKGSISHAQTCVYVHWVWISYLAALLVSQWMFSISVIASQRCRARNGKNAQSNAALKSSPLALLFYGLSDEERKDCGGFKTLGDMDRAAKEMDVQLAPVDESREKAWRFIRIERE